VGGVSRNEQRLGVRAEKEIDRLFPPGARAQPLGQASASRDAARRERAANLTGRRLMLAGDLGERPPAGLELAPRLPPRAGPALGLLEIRGEPRELRLERAERCGGFGGGVGEAAVIVLRGRDFRLAAGELGRNLGRVRAEPGERRGGALAREVDLVARVA